MADQTKRIVNVSVANVWTSYDSARPIDEAVTTNPVDLGSWLNGLTYDTRLELCSSNLLQTQVLFGEEVIVTGTNGHWAEVIVPGQPALKNKDGYPGWIPITQLTEYGDWNITDSEVAVITSKQAVLRPVNSDFELVLSYQTILPVQENSRDTLKVKSPLGSALLKHEDTAIYESYQHIPKGTGTDLVRAGEKFVGLPYLWGGLSSYGYDCSGFSYSMCKAIGAIIPRDASYQAETGKEISLSAIEPGDLLFFAYQEGKGHIHHVGIYYGNGQLLHSPKTGKEIEIIPIAGTIYEKELCAARRYWQEREE
ncbi:MULTISPECIES: C40 family peptidase [Bacillus]|uniref:C40 family peptidase n=1 Tax=Bacillus TaxID=1386 RepID=UPI000C77F7F3|nr:MULTISPECIES: C40 family peptidase [Bacillus]PLR81719.1 peptidase [Bacillus sp. V33-4]RSK43047.1 NlpC/P60 family protein [Bacillus canaveralius]